MQVHNIEDAEDTLSLSNFLVQDDATDSEVAQLSQPNHNSSMSTSSSSSSSSEEDFQGFFTEEYWSAKDTSDPVLSSENIVFCGKVVSSKERPIFRSNSDSFRFIRLKTGSRPLITSRSKSMPSRSASCKSRLRVFMFGSGSGSSKFPAKVDMSDMKSRQVRQQNALLVDGGKEEIGGGHRINGKKGWWRLVDVLGCNGGYGRDYTVGGI